MWSTPHDVVKPMYMYMYYKPTHTPVSEPIHMVARLDEGRLLRVFCTSCGGSLRRAVDKSDRNEYKRVSYVGTNELTQYCTCGLSVVLSRLQESNVQV